MIIEDIDNELEDFALDSTTASLAKSSLKVYSMAIKRFLKTEPSIIKLEDYMNFLQDTVVFHYQSEHGRKKRNLVYFDALIKYAIFKRKTEDDKLIKSKLTPIINFLRKNKPRQLENKSITEYLTIKQRQNVIVHMAEYKHKMIAKLCLELGVRIGSVLRLQASISKPAIQFKVVDGEIAGVIDFFKMKGGKTSRKYLFNKELIEDLQEFLNTNVSDSEYYFLNFDRSYKKDIENVVKTNYKWYYNDLKQALRICGYNAEQWATHSFRKNAAEDIYHETNDPYAVKDFLDHSDMRATEHYLKSTGLLKDKINLQKKYSEQVKKESNT